MVMSKIVYLPTTVAYLRNNSAVSWPGIKQTTMSHESHILTDILASHHTANATATNNNKTDIQC